MFDDLPATRPPRNIKRKRAVFLSVMVHVALVSTFILVQMFAPGKLAGIQLLSTLYMAPPPPPPAPPALPPGREEEARTAARAEEAVPHETPKVVEQPQPVPVDKPAMTQPVVVPNDLARLLEAAPLGGGAPGVLGGIPGGVSGGIPGGLLGGQFGGVLGGSVNAPPPPPPKEPVRVGGLIAEPKVVKLVQPVYPPNAARAHVEGVVVLEATVTEKGQVREVKYISGPQALADAAIRAVQQWQYEPTRLNGTPIPVLLTARVSFSLKNNSR